MDISYMMRQFYIETVKENIELTNDNPALIK